MNQQPSAATVWYWLPNQPDPVVVGDIVDIRQRFGFRYRGAYSEDFSGSPGIAPELPAADGQGVILPTEGLHLPGCIRDAAPDAWGRRVLQAAMSGTGPRSDSTEPSDLDALLIPAFDRVGALGFTAGPEPPQRPTPAYPTLDELHRWIAEVDLGGKQTWDAALQLLPHSGVGGARPKALIEWNGVPSIAKFQTASDHAPVPQLEFIAMRLAQAVGIDVAPTELTEVGGRPVLIVRRFDREPGLGGWCRRFIVSGLTVLGLDEMMARYASYADLARHMEASSADPDRDRRELFRRLVFNVICGNTDDHARNHAFYFADGRLSLSPTFDICPQSRTGGEATQAMAIREGVRWSSLAACIEAAPLFGLDTEEARTEVSRQLQVVEDQWARVCDEAQLPVAWRARVWGTVFCNPFALRGVAA